MSTPCAQCGERPAVPGALAWYAVFLFLLFGTSGWSDRYCRDCAGGRNFLALLVAAGVVVGGFVLTVIFW